VNWIDALVVLGVGAAAVVGFRLGFVTRVLSWIGMLAGAIVSLLVLGPLFDRVDPANHARMTVIAVAVVLLGAFVGQAAGFLAGNRLRPATEDHALSRADAVLGLGAGIVGTLLLVWLLVPVLTQRPGPIAQEISTSWVVRQFDERLPEPPDALQALRAFVGEDNFPDVFAGPTPAPALAAPPSATGLSPETAAEVASSIVRVEGVACRRIQDGSGFVVDDGLVVTNAHVVAGETTTELIRDDGTRVDATVVLFDPDRDIALLAAAGLDRPALPVARARVGDVGGVFGHPRGEPLRIAPFAVARLLDATGRNIYGTDLVQRDVLEVAADLAPGDSGSPLVNPAGEVVGVTFAVARDRATVAYALQTTELEEVLERARGEVGTGPCVTG